jgi:hypothetical protein
MLQDVVNNTKRPLVASLFVQNVYQKRQYKPVRIVTVGGRRNYNP